MTKPAGKLVSLTELRFRPANSNDAARAVIAHHFAEVPHCALAGDDGISPYLGSETGIDAFPGAPDTSAPVDIGVPTIQTEAPSTNIGLRRKRIRGGFAFSIFLHVFLAAAVGILTHAPTEEPSLEEGAMSVTLVSQGDVEAHIAGAEEAVKAKPDKPVAAAAKPKTDAKPVMIVTPVENIATLPDLPKILTAEHSKIETEAVSPEEPKPDPTVEKPATSVVKPAERKTDEKQQEKSEPADKTVESIGTEPVEEKPVEKRIEGKPEEPQNEDKEKPAPQKEGPEKKPEQQENRRQKHGNRGEQQNERRKGDIDAKDKGKSSTSSRGASKKPETGNAAETNYRGLVSRKLSRAKGRMPSPANGRLWVSFTILSDGSISGLSVTKSSGKPAVDAIALKIVRAASPFPPIPADVGRKSWKMTVPMTFRGG
jgi:protein TonB